MTRFARAEGSKSSNKKQFEEPTQWSDMKKEILKTKKEKKSKKKKAVTVPKKSSFLLESLKANCSEDLKTVPDKEEEVVAKNDKNKKGGLKVPNKNSENGKDFIVEDGLRYKISKKNKKYVKRPYYDLPYEENDYMTKYNKVYIKRENIKELEEYKQKLIDEGLSDKEVRKMLFKKEDKFHQKLRIELLKAEIAKRKENDPNFSKPVKKGNFEKPKTEFKFEENELMTLYEDHWIFTKNLQTLNSIKNMKIKRIIKNRKDGNQDANLTEEEDLELKRLMKKEKRRENRLLKLHLIQENSQNIQKSNEKKPNRKKKAGNYTGIQYEETEEMVQFDGFWVKRSAAERLNKLKEKLTAENISEDEILKTLKSERRKEERSFKKENKIFCFNCRKSGHMISACPAAGGDGVNGQDGHIEICYKCGSTEHMARNCKRNKSGSYAHATCFVCKQTGHISRECPQNPRGLYPDGGSCRKCGSVEHFQRNCTEGKKSKEDNLIKLSTLDSSKTIDAIDEPSVNDETTQPPKKKMKKVINF